MIKRVYLLPLNILLLALLSTACTTASIKHTTPSYVSYELSPHFLNLYEALGGSGVLGIPISPLFSIGEVSYQYTAAGLFSYNPIAPLEDQVRLEPIGNQLDTVFALSADLPPSEVLSVYPGFESFYQKLGGETIVGKPITAIQHNDNQGRIEQHFENLGIYQLDSDPHENIQLLHYGEWLCSEVCEFTSPDNGIITNISAVDQPFSDAMLQFTPQFLGRPLSNPYITSTQQLEQIFFNVILTAPVDDPKAVRLLPITEALGISANHNMEIQIAEELSPFLEKYGGIAVAGKPITPFIALSPSIFRQCFTNLCLEYLPNAIGYQQIRPTPLGYLYRQHILTNQFIPGVNKPTSNQQSILIWEEFPFVAPNQPQIIGVNIIENGEPAPGARPVLILNLPGDIHITYHFSDTDDKGSTSLTLNPIDAPLGRVIGYQVCTTNQGEVSTNCKTESFIIWSSP
ncbi:MAG: hypothetical protein H8E28_14700 [Anaerolineae bacterium]|nr:hypothetical protein [Anaerolineae bacterium]